MKSVAHKDIEEIYYFDTDFSDCLKNHSTLIVLFYGRTLRGPMSMVL